VTNFQIKLVQLFQFTKSVNKIGICQQFHIVSAWTTVIQFG